ncbi:MAG: uracil-DNA glycosylase [Planctomycetota bacterium]|nr:uracil-DNA glycosylase [Planctomycetota bacterium]
MSRSAWNRLNQEIVACDLCPRLRDHCRHIANVKRRAYLDDDYWGQPVPNLGAQSARLLIVGLAPGAHGANRTGRMFTGDRSGDWLFRALHNAGFANQPDSTSRHDRLELIDCAITATCHCAPPDNKPTRDEVENCRTWFEQTVELLPVRVFLALGQIGWRSMIDHARQSQWYSGKVPKFGHGAEVCLSDDRWLLGSYHPSQQNTFTGRLTESMLDDVFNRAKQLLSNSKMHEK